MTQVKQDQVKGYCPPEPEPTPQQEECVETVQLTGTVTANCCCCCPQLRTRTIAVDVNPGTPDQVQASALTTVNSLEANGWLVLAHSMFVPGATSGGLKVIITLGWYA